MRELAVEVTGLTVLHIDRAPAYCADTCGGDLGRENCMAVEAVEILTAALLEAYKEGRKNSPIVDAAVDLCAFTRTHEFPKEGTDGFFRLTELIDKLDTVLRAEKLIAQNLRPSGS